MRYSKNLLERLGYKHNNLDNYNSLINSSDSSTCNPEDDMTFIAKGEFANIIDVIFDSPDGTLPNALKVKLTENSPESVKAFVSALCNADIPALKAAPNSEDAFDTIFPRNLQSMSGYNKFRSSIIQKLSTYKKPE